MPAKAVRTNRFAGVCFGIVAIVSAAALLLSGQADFQPEFLGANGFRMRTASDQGYARFWTYSLDVTKDPVELGQIVQAARSEMRRRGYREDRGRGGSFVFYRGESIKLVVLPNAAYDAEGMLTVSKGRIAAWTATSNHLFQRLKERLNLSIW